MWVVGRAFAWEVWREHRLVLAPVLAYLLVLVLLVNGLPAGTLHPDAIAQLTIPLWVAAAFVFMAFSHGEHADLVARESAYPRRAFTLPLPARALAGWPMALGVTAIVLFWLTLGGLILGPAGLPVTVPVVWPAAFLAALFAWAQALMWFPLPLPFLRLIVAVPVLGGLTAGAVLGLLCGVSPALLFAASAGLVPAAYVVAVAGVARARRGDTPTWSWPAFRRREPAAPRRPFASAADAMYWLEWRRNGYVLPVMVGLLLVAQLAVLALAPAPGQAAFQAGVFLASLAVFPPIMAAAAGASTGNVHPWSRKVSWLPAFSAARPVTSAEMVAVKLRVAARSTLITWALAFLAILALLPLSASGTVLARWAGLLIETQGVKGAVLLLLVVLGLVALTWKEFVNQLWVGLTGRWWVVVSLSAALPVGATAVALVTQLVAPRPEAQARLLAAVPRVIALALPVKLAAGLLIARALWRRGLVPPRTLTRFAVAWVLAAAGLFGLAVWLVPPEVYSPPVVGCAAVALGMPLVRLGLAPLALDWNRHR
jgi:hypothetical protein